MKGSIRMPDVFISHGSKDKDIADKVVSYLEDRGLICWIAPRNIIPGSDWAASINTAITASRIFLLIYRANNASSSQVRREVGLASSRSNVFIIPFGVDDTPLHGSLEYYLNTSHWINADFANKDYQFEALYQNIITITGKNLQDISNNTNVDNLPTHHMDAQPESPKTPHKSRRKKKKTNKIAFIVFVTLAVAATAYVWIVFGTSNHYDTNVSSSKKELDCSQQRYFHQKTVILTIRKVLEPRIHYHNRFDIRLFVHRHLYR